MKAGINPRSKSLRTLGETYGFDRLFRATLCNLRQDGGITNVPLYALPCLDRLVRIAGD